LCRRVKQTECIRGQRVACEGKRSRRAVQGCENQLVARRSPCHNSLRARAVQSQRKIEPAPWSGTETPLARVLLVRVKFPACAPAVAGTNSTSVVQLAPGASAFGQTLLTSWNPSGTEKTKLARVETVPLLVTVKVAGLLANPTPVVGKAKDAGLTWMAAAAAPVPLNPTLAALTMDGEETLSVPGMVPLLVGVKTTATLQLVAAASANGQVSWVNENPGEGSTFSGFAATGLELMIVNGCGHPSQPRVLRLPHHTTGRVQ